MFFIFCSWCTQVFVQDLSHTSGGLEGCCPELWLNEHIKYLTKSVRHYRSVTVNTQAAYIGGLR